MNNIVKELLDWLKVIVVSVVIAFFITQVVIVNAIVPTGSMEENIQIDDRIIAFRPSYLLSNPKRFDVIVFKYPDDKSELYVKRVIGMPGEKVEIIDGEVYINDDQVPLESDFIKEEMQGSYGPYEVPEGEYFVLGDNRNWSIDSREWDYKYVIKEDILGRVVFRYFPSPRLYERYK